MEQVIFKFKSKLWVYAGPSAWHFLSVPKKLSGELKNRYNDRTRGFGSLPVKIKIGDTQWRTSIFPDSKTSTYLLPVKLAVRKKENIFEGSMVSCEISIRD